MKALIIDAAVCLQIMYDITGEELDEWVEGKTVGQQRRMEDDKCACEAKRGARSLNGSKPRTTANWNAPKKV